MFLGALLDLGLPLDGLRAALGSLAIEYGSRLGRAGAARRRVGDEVPAAGSARVTAVASGVRRTGLAPSHDHDHGQSHVHCHGHTHDHGHDRVPAP